MGLLSAPFQSFEAGVCADGGRVFERELTIIRTGTDKSHNSIARQEARSPKLTEFEGMQCHHARSTRTIHVVHSPQHLRRYGAPNNPNIQTPAPVAHLPD